MRTDLLVFEGIEQGSGLVHVAGVGVEVGGEEEAEVVAILRVFAGTAAVLVQQCAIVGQPVGW